MASETPGNDNSQGWSLPTLLVLGSAAVTVLLFSIPMYVVGKQHEDRREFLRNYRPPNDFEAFASYCMTYARESTEENDVVFLGDSSCRCNVRTLQFEAETGLRAYNLGSMGLLGMEGHNLILRDYLQRHPKPRVVVLNLLPDAVQLPESAFTPAYSRYIKPRFLWCYGPDTDGSSPPESSFVFFSREGIRSIYGAFLGGFGHFATEPIPAWRGDTFLTLKRNVEMERGFWQVPTELRDVGPTRAATTDPFTVCDEVEQGLSLLLQTCQEREILLLIRLTPFSGKPPEHSERLEAWADDLEARHPFAKLIRPLVLYYGIEFFADDYHCNRQGVEKFTSQLAREVKGVLSVTAQEMPEAGSAKGIVSLR
jgi:hypothetical protein